MEKKNYLAHLRKLLEKQYVEVQQSSSRSLSKNERIEGYMEAGLASSLVTSKELKHIINEAHFSVFGVNFDDRCDASMQTESLLDIPTWIRQGIKLQN
ncbi:hypothetical protein [Thiomicrorhabdus sp.]|uniref:hypothetical protein n=1 Tax=Thiomicrorhabdus sp. TaxID=2039724 RepID=UPI0029C6A12A|nr:hypothetical protein [Thiomicrorhabdus sp.]